MDSNLSEGKEKNPFGSVQIDFGAGVSGLHRMPDIDNMARPHNTTSFCRPANIDIIITPCDSSKEITYDQSDLITKLIGSNRRISRSRRRRKTANWLCSYVNERRLRNAASKKDIEEAQTLIRKDLEIDLNAGDDKQRTSLHISAANGAEDIVRLLLENGAFPNAKDVNGNTPLHLAACSGYIRTVTLLLHYGGDISATDANGKTPLHLVLARQKLFQKSNSTKATNSFDYMKRRAHVKDIADLLKAYTLRGGLVKDQEDIAMLSDKILKVTSKKEVSTSNILY